MYAQRRARLDFNDWKCDALLVSALPNIRYLSGFTGSNALLFVQPGGRVTLYTDPRYTIQASAECDCRVVTVRRGELTAAVAKSMKKNKLRKIGFEFSRLSWAGWSILREQLPRSADLVPIKSAVERLRMVKEPAEIEAIRVSVELNSRAFDNALRKFKPEMHESDLAAEIDYQMRQLGASGSVFETIVASGSRAALPHARPGNHPIQNDQVLLIDMGASLDGYASDMTRTLAVGRISRETQRMYRATLDAQEAAIAAVRSGVTAARIDAAARAVLKQHGLDKEFVHSTGHGLGLEIHEPPRLGRSDKTKLESGMAVTIEPGVYREGLCGIRIEDTVVVTPTGCQILTPTPKELLSI